MVDVDLGKLVGAASAPVALIIATSIFLGNLGGKYAAMVATLRQIAADYRGLDDRDSVRGRSLSRQISQYGTRMRNLIHATSWLTTAILCFIMTVLFTSVGTIWNRPLWTWVTAAFSFAGLLLLGWSVVLEMVENQRAKEDLVLETAEFPDVLENEGYEQAKERFKSSDEGKLASR